MQWRQVSTALNVLFYVFFIFFIFYSGWIHLIKLFCSILHYPRGINLRQETCFKYFARVKFCELCKTCFLNVGFKVLFYFCDCSENSIKYIFCQTYFVNASCTTQKYTLYSYKCYNAKSFHFSCLVFT